jgi:hypothetical protein
VTEPFRVPLSERFHEAAAQWADERIMEEDAALEAKAEQALLEIEHLVANAQDVDFEVIDDGDAIHYEPSTALAEFLEEQAETSGVDPETVLRLYVDLFAGAFLSDDSVTPEA